MSQPSLFASGFLKKRTKEDDAGELGKAFTETEDDEEWVGWVDWDALGGGSGSV